MDNKKIPSWLQDRKKLLIIFIVLLCIIINFFNVNRAAVALKGRIEKQFGSEIDISELVENAINGNYNKSYLSGTYINDYANETLMFQKDGYFEYSTGTVKDNGYYAMENDLIELNLSTWTGTYLIYENSNEHLVLFDGTNYLYYTKLF